MRTPDEVAAMQRLHGLGWGTRRIAAEIGCNRETVQRYLASGAWAPCRVPTRPSLLAGHAAWLADRLRRHQGNADVVRQELASELGIVISLRTVERAVSHLRRELAAEATALVTTLVRGHAEGRLEQRLAQLSKPKLLIVDEFGYLPFEPAAAHLLFQLISRRYERGSILITSNRAVGDWGTVLGDQVVATAILDRLLHHSHVLTIRGDSYRLREKRRAGLIKAIPAPASAGASQ